MTAWFTFSPSLASASSRSFCRIMAEISGGEYSLPPMTTRTSPFAALVTLYGTRLIASCTIGSSNLRPMKRLIEKTVFSGFVTACLRASVPTSRWPVLGSIATTDGVIRLPSAFSRIVGWPASSTAIAEFVVPRSIPMTFAMVSASRLWVVVGTPCRDRFGLSHAVGRIGWLGFRVALSLPERAFDDDLRGPQEALAEPIARADHQSDVLAGGSRVRFVVDRLVARRVEWFTHGSDHLESEPGQRGIESRPQHRNAPRPWVV